MKITLPLSGAAQLEITTDDVSVQPNKNSKQEVCFSQYYIGQPGDRFYGKVRFRTKSYVDHDGKTVQDYCIEIFQRPYFFNLLGKKKWIHIIQTSSLYIGLEFAATYFKDTQKVPVTDLKS